MERVKKAFFKTIPNLIIVIVSCFIYFYSYGNLPLKRSTFVIVFLILYSLCFLYFFRREKA